MTKEEMQKATDEIRLKMPSFDYHELLSRVTDATLLRDACLGSPHSYEKLQLFRLLQDQVTANDVVQKFINETYHIENEYVMQINPCIYEIVPEFILEELREAGEDDLKRTEIAVRRADGMCRRGVRVMLSVTKNGRTRLIQLTQKAARLISSVSHLKSRVFL